MAVVYIQTPAGGLIQGDQAWMHFVLGPRAQVHLTTQAAEKIHTMTANCALQQVSLELDEEAYAEYFPEPVILFPRSRFSQEVTVELGRGASFFLAEIFSSHGSANGTPFAALATSLNVRDPSGRLLLHDRSLVVPTRQSLARPGILDGHSVWGHALFVGPLVPPSWVREVYELISAEPESICGATLLPGERGIGIKAVGSKVRVVRRVLHTAWDYVRAQHLEVPAQKFPK